MTNEDPLYTAQRIVELESQLKTLQQQAESASLAHSLLQAALDATVDGLLIVNREGRVESCNRRFIELWHIPPALLAERDDNKLIGHVLDQLANPEAFIEKVKSLYASPLAESFDVLEFKDGRVFDRHSRPQLMNGEPVGRVWSFHDASDRRRAAEEASRNRAQAELLAAQAAALAELSTPMIPIREEVMVMPLIGAIDNTRSGRILEALLEGVSRSRSRFAIIDITGVTVVDTHVAAALVRAAQAVKLLGAQVILTGIRAEVAQTLIGLGTDLRGLVTRSTLQSGIAYALASLNAS